MQQKQQQHFLKKFRFFIFSFFFFFFVIWNFIISEYLNLFYYNLHKQILSKLWEYQESKKPKDDRGRQRGIEEKKKDEEEEEEKKFDPKKYEGYSVEWMRGNVEPFPKPQKMIATFGDRKKTVYVNFYPLSVSFDEVHVYLVQIYHKTSNDPGKDDLDSESQRYQIVQTGRSG